MSSGSGSSGCYRQMLVGKGIRSASIGAWWRESSTGIGPGSRGGICRATCSVGGRRCGSGTAGMPVTAPGIVFWRSCSPRLMLPGWSIGTCRSTARSTVRTSTPRTRPAWSRTQGALSNYKNRPLAEAEPAGHGIGRSRGGLTTKIHHAVDGKGRPLAAVITGGQRNDGAMLEQVLDDIRVPRLGPGRPRTRPDAVIADKAYSAGVTRKMLHRRGIKVVIPLKSDQIAARKRKGANGGRPPRLDTEMYRGRNVVERSFALVKQWRGMATRYDKLAITYRAAVILSACIVWARLLGDTP